MAKKTTTKATAKKKPRAKASTSTAKAKKATPKAKAAAKTTKKKSKPAGDEEVKVDRRRKTTRRTTETKTAAKKTAPKVAQPKLERREKVNRRRQIDPTTCERDYSNDELEFMAALDLYKRNSGRMFPTCSEILEVLRTLGYNKKNSADAANDAVEPSESPEVTSDIPEATHSDPLSADASFDELEESEFSEI